MYLNYRGHQIRITRAGVWSAELVELSTGAVLPTKATAGAQEELTVCVERAACLVDLYVEGERRVCSERDGMGGRLPAAMSRRSRIEDTAAAH